MLACEPVVLPAAFDSCFVFVLQATAERLARGKGLRTLSASGKLEDVKQIHSDFEFFDVRSSKR